MRGRWVGVDFQNGMGLVLQANRLCQPKRESMLYREIDVPRSICFISLSPGERAGVRGAAYSINLFKITALFTLLSTPRWNPTGMLRSIM